MNVNMSLMVLWFTDPCVKTPCETGDICTRDGLGGRICTNPCDSSPCKNGGNCTKDGAGGYVCDCSNTYYLGENCTKGYHRYLKHF